MICLKIRTFVVSATTTGRRGYGFEMLWFAWKFVPLWYQQQPAYLPNVVVCGCDLLENSYLCGISNNNQIKHQLYRCVVICLKIRTFVVSATTSPSNGKIHHVLWFAWKFVPLWYQQQRREFSALIEYGCDLLENSYLCGISNNLSWIISWLADSYKIVAQKNNWYYKMKSHSFRMGFFTLMTMQWRIIFKLL